MTTEAASRLDFLAEDEHDERHEVASAAAAARVEFQLIYDRAARRRWFSRNELDGPAIPDAYGDGHQSGEWSDFDDPDEPTEEAWIDKYAAMAISEAVHEALEWFRVDGRPWLDPHGEHETRIHQAVNELAARLAELRHEVVRVREETR